MIKKYTTTARPTPKNEIWQKEQGGIIYICERPRYLYKKLEQELFAKGLNNESVMLFGKTVPQFFDDEGRWWADRSLSSGDLLKVFIEDPGFYIRIMSKKVQDVISIIALLRTIDFDKDKNSLRSNFITLFDATVTFYSYYSSTFIVSDEMVCQFRQLLDSFLKKKESNRYFTDFLRAEITKEAIKYNAVEETTGTSKDLFYSERRPVLFYKEPKFFAESSMDNEVISKLFASEQKGKIKEFISLRLTTPLCIQINEEAQYVESKMLLPVLRMALLKIKELFVEQGIIDEGKDIRDLSYHEILSHFEF